MTFSDIFKSNFLANVTSVTILDMFLALAFPSPSDYSFSLSIRRPMPG